MNSVARLATMGEMAAGISHELNQPLAAIANYAQACVRLLRLPAADIPEISDALEQIAGQALRGRRNHPPHPLTRTERRRAA
jgi:two-component system sensor histidine kinase DctS/two-component system sensor kinase FixL